MNIKLDENLPYRLGVRFSAMGHNVETIHDEKMTGAHDAEVWEAAQREGCFLITQDLDFSDTRRFIPGLHNGVLLVRLRNPTRRALLERIELLFRSEDVNSWKRCFCGRN